MPATSAARRSAPALLLALCFLTATGTAWAQKYPGQTIPDTAAPDTAAPPRPRAPARTPSYAPAAPRGAEPDAQAQAQASQLPLDPATANLQSRLPTDVPGTIRQLGLHVPNGTRVDLRGRPVTAPEVVNALQH